MTKSNTTTKASAKRTKASDAERKSAVAQAQATDAAANARAVKDMLETMLDMEDRRQDARRHDRCTE